MIVLCMVHLCFCSSLSRCQLASSALYQLLLAC